MYQRLSSNIKGRKKQGSNPDEPLSRNVRIVITNSNERGTVRGDNLAETMAKNEGQKDSGTSIARTQSIEVDEKGGWFSTMFSSKKIMEKEDLISMEEADDGSVEAGFQRDRAKYKMNADTFETAAEDDKYDINKLRVPCILDQAEMPEKTQENLKDVPIDDDSLLRDPYSEIRPQDDLMKDEELNTVEDERTEKSRFMMCMASKALFLLGSILFLVLAVHDYQRVKGAGHQVANLEDSKVAPNQNVDDDVDPFVTGTGNSTGWALEEEMARAEANKEERAGGALASHVWGTRRRMQTRVRRVATNWYTQYWADLPENVQESAGLLGYTEARWNAGESVYTDRLHWHELTPVQQASAYLVFGYDEDSWNDYVDRFLANLANTAAPTWSPTQAPVDPSHQDTGDPEGGGEPDSGNGTTETNDETSQGDVETSEGGAAIDRETGDAVEGNGGDTGNPGDQGSDGNEATEGEREDQAEPASDEDSERGGTVSEFNSGYSVNIDGDYPAEERGKTFKALYICAALCFMMVGIMDALHQQLGFHVVMIVAGIMGIMAGGFTQSNEKAFHVCHSISSHLFLLQAVLLVYSRLLLNYDNSVRRVLNVADGLFVVGALMNVVVSYMRYDDTSMAMTKTALAASVFWCVAAIIYVAITAMLWRNRHHTSKSDGSGGECSLAESCNVIQSGGGDCEDCEVSLPDQGHK